MGVAAVTTFFALLAVVALLAVLAVAGLSLLARVRGGLPPALVAWRDGLAALALPGAFAVATTCTLGSLYLSEVARFPPCELCWYQRIAMYPLVPVLGVAALRRDSQVKWYALPLAVIGLTISAYHYLLERFPGSIASSCSTEVPCTTVWVWKFHFLSIPGMAGIGFALIITLLLVARRLPPTGPRVRAPEAAAVGSGASLEEVAG
jgi:disulfide bond formation protein DsbB